MVKTWDDVEKKGVRERRPHRRPPLLRAAAGVAWLLIGAFFVAPSIRAEAARPIQGMVATLEDEVRDLPEQRIAWSTFWKLCWEEYPGASGYELELLTSEGVSPELRRQSARCFRVEVASGENKRNEGMVHRDIQLALQKGQLACRVRAVFDAARVSEWSSPVVVGETPGQDKSR